MSKLTVEEQIFIEGYKKVTQAGPYPVQFITVDIVLIHKQDVLLITRKGPLGKGLIALPGGYVNPEETLLSAAFREMEEETGIKLQTNWAIGNFYADDPNRSPLGRVLTQVFVFKIPDTENRPAFKAGDDAAYAAWKYLYNVNEPLFQDHYNILFRAVNKYQLLPNLTGDK